MNFENIIKDCLMKRCVFDLPGATHFFLEENGNWVACWCPDEHGFSRKELVDYLGPSHPLHPDWKPKVHIP